VPGALDAVVFDWGGTLTPWRTVDPRHGWRALADVLHTDETRARQVAEALVAAEAVLWARARDEHRSFTLREVIENAQRALGSPIPHDPAALAAYRDFWDPHTLTDPDVPELLAGLRARGLRLGVLSSTAWPAQWHLDVLRRDGVLDAFDATTWSSDLEWTKPHPEAFQAALRAVGARDPRRCVFVGDRPYDDIHGAAAAGMRTILVPHSDIPAHQAVEVDVLPDAVVQRLSEVLDVVDRWLAEPAPAPNA
jgi:putative hydrolase of the HAD superfamily